MTRAQDVYTQFGVPNSNERGIDVVTDAEGATFVLAYTDGALFPKQTGSNDIVLMKYGPDHTQRLWGVQVGTADPDRPFDITVDRLGNPIIACQLASGLAALIKYSSSGTHVWTKTFGQTSVNGVAVASDGSIFFVGTATASASTPIRLVRCSPQGVVLWEQKTGQSGDYGVAIDLDPDDNPMFLVAVNQGSTYFNGVYRYDALGVFKWYQTFGAPASNTPHDIVVDSVGDAIICGTSTNTWPNNQHLGKGDAFVIKIDGMSGSAMWYRSVGTVQADVAWGVTVDGADNVYIAGKTEASIEPGVWHGGASDYFLARLVGPQGVVEWVEQFGTGDDDVAHGVTVDVYGNVIFTGYVVGAVLVMALIIALVVRSRNQRPVDDITPNGPLAVTTNPLYMHTNINANSNNINNNDNRSSEV
ncbi:hypothetical protein PTSG_08546 [Salpingoeca rosetta]|uniref:Bulb-type lectin domain-containing protein n=1 Tax=Salpingoeca rosetta (strain ATCC 50818 / BSB-021) TaxID=946362 RepID=F2UK01_SALR5|nr:uncharacterized protein PTSG_08546 [Salpingoeca rosetta]EGD77450.1 hypothetical protein PTSG_08546 [Salpingoeca rosetta]|eukprot:XP_004990338.1 hypothetical protein PTSG_08546 [Salpingoeca rosetta]